MPHFVYSDKKDMTSKVIHGGPSIQQAVEGPAAYTVEFTVGPRRPFNPLAGNGNINPVATVSFGLGGNAYTRKLSVFNGASISGVTDLVTVVCSDETSPADPSPRSIYPVTLVVGKGVRANTQNPPIYQVYYTNDGVTLLGMVRIGFSGNFTLNIPQDAGITSVMVQSNIIGGPTPGSMENLIEQQDFSAATVKLYNPNLYNFVPINPQCTGIVLYNNDTANKAWFSVTFGIDG